jgi:hypothetical protein
MPRILFCTTLLLVVTTTSAQNPIPRQGNSCPTGTYKSGDYCKPFKSSEDKVIIQKKRQQVPYWVLQIWW